jgi:hypothetical protein
LNLSVLKDLQRFENDAIPSVDFLAVLAASVRHARPLTVHLKHGSQLLITAILPKPQRFECAIDLCTLSAADLVRLSVQHVEPTAALCNPEFVAASAPCVGPLGPLLWRVALLGASDELLPEIAGPARYRVAQGFAGVELPMSPQEAALIEQLHGRAITFGELMWRTSLKRSQVRRVLNALYLQSVLITSRLCL